MFQHLDNPTLKIARSKFVCPDYQPTPGEVGCMQYIQNGACRLQKHLMCVEWLRKSKDETNRASARSILRSLGVTLPEDLALPEPPAAPPSTLPAEEEDPYGEIVPQALSVDPKPALKPTWIGVTEAPLDVADGKPVSGDLGMLTDEAIAALEQQGLEVDLRTADMNTLTLVPTHTGKDRPELTYRDLRTLVLACQVIPGMRLVALRRRPPEEEEETK
jgi:hypothetical protein